MKSLSKYTNKTEGKPFLYTQEFMVYIESHLGYLRSLPGTHILAVDPQLAHKHEGDFYALMQSLKVARSLWWPMMRINGLTSSMDFSADTTELAVLDEDAYNRLLVMYETVRVRN